MATKLEKLLQKESQLKAQIQQAKAIERTLEKKRDTRRKILVGAAVLARVDNGEWPKADLNTMMDGFLTRPNERELFNLDSAAEDVEAGGENSDNDSKAAVSEVSTTREKATKEKTQAKKSSGSTAGLSEPDFDVDKEFNL